MTADDATVDKSSILAEVIDLVNELAGDWDFEGEVTPETYFIRDLGLESLDLVVLGTSIQYRYGQLPFAEYLAELGQRPVEERDVSVAEFVDFVSTALPAVGTGNTGSTGNTGNTGSTGNTVPSQQPVGTPVPGAVEATQ
jgi:acyl carrier protein